MEMKKERPARRPRGPSLQFPKWDLKKPSNPWNQKGRSCELVGRAGLASKPHLQGKSFDFGGEICGLLAITACTGRWVV